MPQTWMMEPCESVDDFVYYVNSVTQYTGTEHDEVDGWLLYVQAMSQPFTAVE